MNREDVYEWDKWTNEIPLISFHPDTVVRLIPPFADAMVRFFISHKDNQDFHLSVYLDCYNKLGYMPYPYWEVYDGNTNDCTRFHINDTESLMKFINESLNV